MRVIHCATCAAEQASRLAPGIGVYAGETVR
jgi:hypothetical protein